MNILVTGGAGFIGSHVVEALTKEDHRVLIYDNLSTGKIENLSQEDEKIEFRQLDLKNAGEQDVSKVDAVVHLAAKPSVVESWDSPIAAHRENLTAILWALQLAEKSRGKHLVFASSAAVYGDPNTIPTNERFSRQPISPYGIQKSTCEDYMRLYGELWGLSTVALRFFNVYGPRQDPSSAYAGVISKFVNKARSGSQVAINGAGEQTRDFVYVQDVAQAVAKAAVGGNEICKGHLALNVGSGIPCTIKKLAETILELCNRPTTSIEYSQSVVGDIAHSLADVSEIKKVLEWAPENSLTSGLAAYLSSERR